MASKSLINIKIRVHVLNRLRDDVPVQDEALFYVIQRGKVFLGTKRRLLDVSVEDMKEGIDGHNV